MTLEELRAMVQEIVQAQIQPLKDVRRQYADALANPPTSSEPVAEDGQLEPGIRLARMCKLMVLGKSDPERALYIAEKTMYPEDKSLHAALKQMTVGTPSEGGFLVPERYAAEIIPLLRAKAVVRRLGARTLNLAGGVLNIPKITGGATAYYVGESRDITKSQMKVGNLRLSGKKLACLVPMSNELIRSNAYNADQMVRDDMIQTIALKEDHAAMYGTGTEFTPLGIINTPGIRKAAKNALPDSDYLASLVGSLMAKNLPWTSVGWAIHGALWSTLYNLKDSTGNYIHREEMNQGKLIGLPFAVSNQISYNDGVTGKPVDIFFGDWSEFIIGEEMGLEIDASKEASWWDGSALQSAFSRDETVIRVIAKHDFGLRHAEAFNVQTNVYTV